MNDEELNKAAEKYAENHGFRVPYDGSDNFYDDIDVKASKEGFIAGAKWAMEQGVRFEMDFDGYRPVELTLDKYVLQSIGVYPHCKVTIQIRKKDE